MLMCLFFLLSVNLAKKRNIFQYLITHSHIKHEISPHVVYYQCYHFCLWKTFGCFHYHNTQIKTGSYDESQTTAIITRKQKSLKKCHKHTAVGSKQYCVVVLIDTDSGVYPLL